MFARSLVVLALVAAGSALAAGQPDGKKVIPTARTVELSGEIPGYAFFTVEEKETPPVPEQPPPLPMYRAKRVNLVPKVPQAVPTNLDLQIVPESALKQYPDEEKLGFALAKSLVPGAQSVAMVGTGQEADESDPRTQAKYRFVFHRVDANAYPIYDRYSDNPDDPRQIDPQPKRRSDGGTESEGENEKPRGSGSWLIIVAGVVVVAAAVGAGVWIARRKRPEDDE
jgi:hypothetical protein